MHRKNMSYFYIFTQSALGRRSWQQSSGLMPVFEEDEENSDWPGEEEGKPAEEAHVHNQNQLVVKA